MNQNTIQEFRDVLKRIYAKGNSEKYNLLYAPNCSKDEDRIRKLCEEFWHPDYDRRTSDIEKYEPNPNLDNTTAKRYIKELTHLLDELGWEPLQR